MKIILKDWSELPWYEKVQYLVVPTLEREGWKAAAVVFLVSPLLTTFWLALGVVMWPFIHHLWPAVLLVFILDKWRK